MFKEAPAPTAEQLAEIEKLEAEAARALQMKEESFQRCDTDGFVSQWAHQMTAEKNRKKIEILRNGGCASFPVLVFEGEVIATKIYTFPDSIRPWLTVERWKLPNDVAEKLGRKWVPVNYIGKSRIQKKLGLSEEYRWFPAYAEITTGSAKSTGFSGMANAYVGVFKRAA